VALIIIRSFTEKKPKLSNTYHTIFGLFENVVREIIMSKTPLRWTRLHSIDYGRWVIAPLEGADYNYNYYIIYIISINLGRLENTCTYYHSIHFYGILLQRTLFGFVFFIENWSWFHYISRLIKKSVKLIDADDTHCTLRSKVDTLGD